MRRTNINADTAICAPADLTDNGRNPDRTSAPGFSERGVTLLELMIVVAILAIISAIAIPSYRNHVIKSNRAAAEGFMHQVANREEQILADARNYVAVTGNASFSAAPGFPNGGLQMNMPTSVSTNYNVTVTVPAVAAGTPLTYTITAVPINPPQNDYQCQTITLTSDGTKGVAAAPGFPNAPSGTAGTCW